MADEYDADIVQQMLEEALAQMRVKQNNFGKRITAIVKEIHDLVKSEAEVPADLAMSPGGNKKEDAQKQVISARACVVCGRDDRPGLQRKSGFKCTDCVGLPSKLEKFSIQIEEMDRLDKHVNDEGEKVINEFAFLNNLGKGSYGKVKLAVHTKSDQKYAAKILNKQTLMKVHKAGTQQTAMDAVRTEIAILKALNHPNVIKMYALIDDPDETKLYLIMEFLEGGQLFQVNADGAPSEPMERERLKKHIVGIGRGLQYLHQKNIVHRDIKPENILLDLNDNVKLTDFGVSSSCREGDDTMHSTEGSPAYLPPEEFEQKPVKGKAHDIWSFGVTLYAMAFGYLPFRAQNRQELADLVIKADPVYPVGADPLLVDLLKSMLAKDQDNRLRADQVLEHPFVSDVRTVKGYPVETIKVNLQVVTGVEPSFLPEMPENTHAIVIPVNENKRTANDRRGLDAMLSFMKLEGPEFQIIRSGVYCSTFYSIKSDPRRRSQSHPSKK
jgi:serine/threonine protein kinase